MPGHGLGSNWPKEHWEPGADHEPGEPRLCHLYLRIEGSASRCRSLAFRVVESRELASGSLRSFTRGSGDADRESVFWRVRLGGVALSVLWRQFAPAAGGCTALACTAPGMAHFTRHHDQFCTDSTGRLNDRDGMAGYASVTDIAHGRWSTSSALSWCASVHVSK